MNAISEKNSSEPRKRIASVLKVGDVFTAPSQGMDRPMWVTWLRDAGSVRFVRVADLETGEHDDTMHQLVNGTEILVQDVVREHHFYKNTSNNPITVELGRHREPTRPGDTFRYTGNAKPSLFPEYEWEHRAEPVETSESHQASVE